MKYSILLLPVMLWEYKKWRIGDDDKYVLWISSSLRALPRSKNGQIVEAAGCLLCRWQVSWREQSQTLHHM